MDRKVAADGTPLQLDEARRQKLLAAFQKPALRAVQPRRRRKKLWFVPLSIAAALVGLLTLSVTELADLGPWRRAREATQAQFGGLWETRRKAYITGTYFSDFDTDGVKNPGEPRVAERLTMVPSFGSDSTKADHGTVLGRGLSRETVSKVDVLSAVNSGTVLANSTWEVPKTPPALQPADPLTGAARGYAIALPAAAEPETDGREALKGNVRALVERNVTSRFAGEETLGERATALGAVSLEKGLNASPAPGLAPPPANAPESAPSTVYSVNAVGYANLDVNQSFVAAVTPPETQEWIELHNPSGAVAPFAETARLREVNSKQLLTSVDGDWVEADSKTRPAGPTQYARRSFQVDPGALASGVNGVDSFSFGESQNRSGGGGGGGGRGGGGRSGAVANAPAPQASSAPASSTSALGDASGIILANGVLAFDGNVGLADGNGQIDAGNMIRELALSTGDGLGVPSDNFGVTANHFYALPAGGDYKFMLKESEVAQAANDKSERAGVDGRAKGLAANSPALNVWWKVSGEKSQEQLAQFDSVQAPAIDDGAVFALNGIAMFTTNAVVAFSDSSLGQSPNAAGGFGGGGLGGQLSFRKRSFDTLHGERFDVALAKDSDADGPSDKAAFKVADASSAPLGYSWSRLIAGVPTSTGGDNNGRVDIQLPALADGELSSRQSSPTRGTIVSGANAVFDAPVAGTALPTESKTAEFTYAYVGQNLAGAVVPTTPPPAKPVMDRTEVEARIEAQRRVLQKQPVTPVAVPSPAVLAQAGKNEQPVPIVEAKKPSFVSRMAFANPSTPAVDKNSISVAASDLARPALDPTPAKPSTPPPTPQPEVLARDNAFSTFSLNVSDVSFKLAAASLEKGAMPDVATIRSEEFINALDYRDPLPAPGVPVAFAWERARYPFAQNRDVLRFSVKTAAQGREAGRPLNLVLLLDNSGSMERADRVRIIQESLRTLAAQLKPQDKLSVVSFARTPRLWADGVPGAQAGEVAKQIGALTPEGGTNLEDALDLAYRTALRHYAAASVNRVVLLTDGAANLGNVEPKALKAKVESFRQQGVALDCFGIGWEGFNDDLLEQLSRNGDGRYGFINAPEDAATEFAGQLAGALRVAASDVKVQVEFNPKRVTAWRQVGYAKHQLTKQQFRDNTVDAAEIGAAEAGNGVYIIETNPNGEGPIATVRARFRVPQTSDYREHEWLVPFGSAVDVEQSSPALRLATGASAFSEWLAGSPFAGEVTTDRLLGILRGVPEVYGIDPRPKKLEWMIRQAKSISGK